MKDRENIIKGLEICVHRVPGKYDCNECPYEIDGDCCEINLTNDALFMLKEQPQIIRCKDCKHRPQIPNGQTYGDGFDLKFPEGSKCPCQCLDDGYYSWYPEDDWFCPCGEPKEGAHE